MSKHCTVACDTPNGVQVCELELPDNATIAVALAAARLVLGSSVADWERAATGIYGATYPRDHITAEGDRVELYRGLKTDPRAARRARAALTSGPRRV
jgi:putative ubiquitin-RnfH superfamily antitoxin RatB of RatAB toxin-antitoxin module